MMICWKMESAMRSLMRIFVLPRAVAVRLADGVEHALDFGVELVAECLVAELEARLDQRGVLFDSDVRGWRRRCRESSSRAR